MQLQLTFPQLSIKQESNDDAVSPEPMRSCIYHYHVLPPFGLTRSDKAHGNSADIRDYDHPSSSLSVNITVLQLDIILDLFNCKDKNDMEQLLAYFGGL